MKYYTMHITQHSAQRRKDRDNMTTDKKEPIETAQRSIEAARNELSAARAAGELPPSLERVEELLRRHESRPDHADLIELYQFMPELEGVFTDDLADDLAKDLISAIHSGQGETASKITLQIEKLNEALLAAKRAVILAYFTVGEYFSSEDWAEKRTIFEPEETDLADVDIFQELAFVENIEALFPHIKKEVAAAERSKGRKITLTEFFTEKDPESGKTLFERSIDRYNTAATTPAAERLQPIPPSSALILNSKIAINLSKDMLGAGDIAFNVGTKKQPMEVIASMEYDDPSLTFIGREPFTPYDRSVYNAVCSLYQAGNKSFTPQMVYRAMNGITDGRYISPQAVAAVTRSIEKQRVTKLVIKYSQQAKRYPELAGGERDDMLLAVGRGELTFCNGERREAYKFNTIPILYDYSRKIGQVISVPPALLDTKDKVKTTQEVTILREYLLRRIAGMKSKNNLVSRKITYSAIHEELGIELDNLPANAKKDKTRKLRNNTAQLLNHFIENKYIKGYTEYKSGRTITGIEINL